MRLAPVIEEYYDAFLARYKNEILPGQLQALNAMLSCRTDLYGLSGLQSYTTASTILRKP